MEAPSDIVLKVGPELGAPGRPQTILIQGEIVDTGCVAWTLPEDTEGVWSVLARYRELRARYKQLAEHVPADPVLSEIRQPMEQLFARYKPHKLASGTTVYDLEDVAGGDPRARVHLALWRVRELLRDDPVSAYLGPHAEGMNSEVLLVAPTRCRTLTGPTPRSGIMPPSWSLTV